MPDFLDSLNERQRAAVCHEDGGALVLAGAGTGKTRVLTSRIAWLASARNCPPRAILAVTFTNKAAKEMRARVVGLSAFPPGEFALGTFHGVCHRMLRRHAAAAGWDRNFQILDSSDQKTFVRRLLQNEMPFVAQEFLSAGKSEILSECARYINAAKDRGLRADAAEDSRAYPQMREIYARYEAACRRENKVDFAELLLSAIELLRDDGDLRRHYAARFRHILIDEFQDTSPLQYRWLRLLDSGDNVFFAVGDDDQSIYAFRGADPQNMRRAQADLRARALIRLEQNYRSTGNILAAANALIAPNKNRLGKTLFTRAAAGAPLVVCRAARCDDEAEEIARMIKDKIADGVSADDIAVLYRTNAQSRLLEKAMMERGLPYRIYGGTRFFDRLEIKHALSYMRLAVADDRDALLRVINTPPRGIGKKTLAALAASGDMFAALAESSAPKIAAFRALLGNLRARRETDSLAELARAAVEDGGLLAHYESRPQEAERAENLREFVSAAAQFEKDFAENDEDAARAFLANVALESGEAQGAAGEAVNLLTVHAAKGLEFSIAHIAGLEDGMFPHAMSLDSIYAGAAEVEEERRLMYVAVTRARSELFLHFADCRMIFGKPHPRPPSRFFNELPPDAVSGLETVFARPQQIPQQAHPRRTHPKRRPDSDDKARSAAAVSDAPSDSDSQTPKYRPGDTVRHPKHGDGVVLRCANDEKMEIAFKEGVKTFHAALAVLTRLR